MSDQQRDDLLICVGKLKGILSMPEFDEEDSALVNDRIHDVLQDMELIIKGVDGTPFSLKGGDGDDV